MHHSKLPLTAWFWAAYLMATHSNGISALKPQRQLAFGLPSETGESGPSTRHAPDRQGASLMKSPPGLPMKLGNAAAARV
jgi:hypothetical protein